jgi:4'-phosphopantetheinyl transferase
MPAIDLWSIRLSAVRPALGDPAPLLSPDERSRAARLPALAAARFMAARRALRDILAGYADLAPEDLAFSYAPSGKPRFANGPPELEFSLAHSADLALCAVARGRPVGVDLEALRPVPDALALASDILDRATVERLARLASSARSRAFLIAWSRHEALAKAGGNGLAGVWPPWPATSNAVRSRESNLEVHELALPPGYVGALATHSALSLNERRFPAHLPAVRRGTSLSRPYPGH